MINLLRIGGVEVTNCMATVIDLQKLDSYGIHIDGIIGDNFLKFFKIRIDYNQQKITFSNQINQLEEVDSGYKMKLKSLSGRFFAEFKLSHISNTIPGLIDTGMSGDSYIMAPIKYLEQLKPALNCHIITALLAEFMGWIQVQHVHVFLPYKRVIFSRPT
jgi:predicted aspartyl protease